MRIRWVPQVRQAAVKVGAIDLHKFAFMDAGVGHLYAKRRATCADVQMCRCVAVQVSNVASLYILTDMTIW